MGMKRLSLLLIFNLCFWSCTAQAVARTTVQDAIAQSSKLLRCWENVNAKGAEPAYALSEPIYELCSYMPHPQDWNKFFVNGVDENSDDYSAIKGLFASGTAASQTLTVCLQEAFQFVPIPHPSQVSLRCLCKRTGCNVPKTLIPLLEVNRLSLSKFDI